jgi:UDP-3-O-[3-hydroxymyristoyl] N-acetylglucosamine deacetylase
MQTTLQSDLSFDGIGLHSGRPARLTLRPARANTGIVFVRTDAAGQGRRGITSKCRR